MSNPIYGDWGPGFPRQPGPEAQNPSLDALRALGALNPTGSGGNQGIQPRRLSESDNWSYPPPATPPEAQSGLDQILNSLSLAYTNRQQKGPRFSPGGPQYPAIEA